MRCGAAKRMGSALAKRVGSALAKRMGRGVIKQGVGCGVTQRMVSCS
jgi:hypothetical protein